MMLTSRITQGHRKPSLVSYLSNRFTYLSKEEWLKRIQDHSVLVNNAPSLPDTVLNSGDIVSYDLPEFAEPEADTNYSIVYEDEWIMAVDKPGNLLVHKAGRSITKNLVFLLRHCSANPSYASVHAVSRLDRETSGLVLFAKNMDCLRRLHRDFAAGSVAKEYLAVVHNTPGEKSMTVDLPIGQDVASEVSYKFAVDTAHGKSARTVIETVSSAGTYAVIRAKPFTGRTHQIRIHCAAIGTPVVGDKLYGMDEAAYLTWRNDPPGNLHLLEFPRQALHCRTLCFEHPVHRSPLTLNAPIPQDMAALIDKLGLAL
jgi:RluA family pseudouridine synthase